MKTVKMVLRILLFAWWMIPCVWLVMYPLLWLMDDRKHVVRFAKEMTREAIFGFEEEK